MKKRKTRIVGKKTTARKKAAKKMVVKKKPKPQKAELISRARLSREMRAVRSILTCIRTDLSAIKQEQQAIAQSVDAVMKDYIRHPLKVDGMNQAAFRSLVDAAAQNSPASFREDFTAKLEASND